MPNLNYCSYLLRLWREHAEAPWRVMLVAVADPDTYQHFATLDACFAFLHAQTRTQDGCVDEPGVPNAPLAAVETIRTQGA